MKVVTTPGDWATLAHVDIYLTEGDIDSILDGGQVELEEGHAVLYTVAVQR